MNKYRAMLIKNSSLAIPIAIFLMFAAYYEYRIGKFVIDDAYIFFRYAENLVNGYGLTWNPNGEMVEGYTSFLWTIWLSVFFLVGINPLIGAKLSGIFLSLTTLCLISGAMRKLWSNNLAEHLKQHPRLKAWFFLLPALYLATNRTYTGWAIEAMDGKLFQCCLVAAWLVWINQFEDDGSKLKIPWTGILLAMTVLSRPEGWLFAGTAFLMQFHASWKEKKWPNFLLNSAAFLLLAGAHLSFRYIVYDELVPNTFSAKVHGAQFDLGIPYLGVLFKENYFWFSLPFFIMGCVDFWGKKKVQSRFLVITVPLYFFYLAMIGGDFFEFRLLDPILPFYAILTVSGMLFLFNDKLDFLKKHYTTITVSAGIVLLVLNLFTIIVPVKNNTRMTVFDRSGVNTWEFGIAGYWLANNLPPGEIVATRAAGILPYVSKAQCIDMLGLNDREIAHMDNFAKGKVVAHQRVVTINYIVQRGATYLVNHPRINKEPSTHFRDTSIELKPGLYFCFTPLQKNATFKPGKVYKQDEHNGLKPGWPLEPPNL